jgi:2-polyprenyl-3-methyl-5-hydroxy-6-metoxy-1,4-benzoquinol methylase
MYEKLEICPACKSSKISNHFISKDYVVSGESFALSHCDSCDLVFTNPRPLEEFIGKYYNSDNYIPHTKKVNVLNFIYRIIRSINSGRKVGIINQLSEKGIILDVGCGTGEFLAACKKDGWDISGIEPADAANSIAMQNLGINILKKISDFEKDNTFDIITFWHVLEHIYDIHDTLEAAKRVLKKGGKILIALPNIDSYDSKLFREYWAAIDVPRHLYHFNQNSFIRLAKEHNLKLIETIPLYFDAYYISLLSYQYQSNNRNWIKSLISGYKSNSYAKLNQNNFSSIVYCLKK